MAIRFTVLVLAVCLGAVSFSAQAEEVTAAIMLKKGTVLADADVNIVTNDGEDFAEVREAYIGLELKRTIYEGHKITRGHVGAPIIVKRNTPVTMVYTYGTMKLTAKGRALGAGAIGDSITVMNTSSRKKIYGIVSGPEMVEVTQ